MQQRQYNGAETVLSTNGAGTGHSHAKKKMNLNADLHSSQKLTQNVPYSIHLNVKHKTRNSYKVT